MSQQKKKPSESQLRGWPRLPVRITYLGLLTLITKPNTTNITAIATTKGNTILIKLVSKLFAPNQFKNLKVSFITAYTIIEHTDAIIIGFNINFLLSILRYISLYPYYTTIKKRGNFSVTPLNRSFIDLPGHPLEYSEYCKDDTDSSQ